MTNYLREPPAISDVDIVWITAGLSCDGDSVAVTGATQPSIEDVIGGAIPGLPRVHLHNPVLAYDNGEDFAKIMREAAAGRLDPFVLVVEGSIPNEKIHTDGGFWAAVVRVRSRNCTARSVLSTHRGRASVERAVAEAVAMIPDLAQRLAGGQACTSSV